MDMETDPRQAMLEARRYHLVVCMSYGDGLRRDGAFFYDSLNAARTFVRRQFEQWQWTLGIDVGVKRSDWKAIWKAGCLFVGVELEDGERVTFVSEMHDQENPESANGVWQKFFFANGEEDNGQK